MTLRFAEWLACSLFLGAVLTGCTGESGSAGLPQVSPSSAAATPAQATAARFVIAVPKPNSGSARAAYVSPSTQSMTVSIEQAGVVVLNQSIGLTPTSTGCASSSAGTTCTFALPLNAGSYTASITTYSGAGGSGNALSIAQAVPFTVVADQANQVSLTLNGIPAKLVTTSDGVDAVYVEAQDASGNVIVGPGSPTFTAARSSGATVAAITQPTQTHPNVISFAPVSGATSGTETIGVTASYPSGTNACAQSGAVCTLATAATVSYVSQTLFVSDDGDNNVAQFALPLSSSAEVGDPLPYPPYPLTHDAKGDVFVATESPSSTFALISPPYTGIRWIDTTAGEADSIAAAPNGDVIVADTDGTLTVYSPPFAPPVITAAGPNQAYAVTVDASNNAYVAYGNNTLSVLAPPYTGAATATVATSSLPISVLLSDNDLIVGEFGPIEVFALPLASGASPIATITAGVNGAYQMALDPNGNLWIANTGGGAHLAGSIAEYTSPLTSGENPAVTIAMPVAGHSSYSPYGLAFDAAGNLYVCNSKGGPQAGGVLEFSPPITSSSSPAIAIENDSFNQLSFATVTPAQFTVSP
jgi:hypothetical protein